MSWCRYEIWIKWVSHFLKSVSFNEFYFIEIWYLVTINHIGDYKEYDVDVDYFATVYIDFFYLPGTFILIFLQYIPKNEDYTIYFYLIQIVILLVGGRYVTTVANLGKIPFNCNFDHDLPENIKLACKARFVTCTLGFSSYALPFMLFLFRGLHSLLNYLQKDLFVL
ncbi:hypothetical protein C1645_794003 [Glomus cerebriforme]|uniref:Uncharacterized protein n=1 Tax=Glomus cerebriforme TaxID=658196 RepID=A0A397SA85_9GLOM|nr:hypothetical protein C1645_794003 [Glomus cerebriforme]